MTYLSRLLSIRKYGEGKREREQERESERELERVINRERAVTYITYL